jgi:hypothetical protein
MPVAYPFQFPDGSKEGLVGSLLLEDPLIHTNSESLYRLGRVVLSNNSSAKVVVLHSRATATFIYLHRTRPKAQFLEMVGLSSELDGDDSEFILPGQLILGAERTHVVGRAVQDLLCTPVLQDMIRGHSRDELVILPVLREGSKYQITEGLFDSFGYYFDEIVVDAHHLSDKTVSPYQRRVDISCFKDGDLTDKQRKSVRAAVIGDSIASGVVLIGLIERVQQRFQNLRHIEIIAPFATILGLARLAAHINSEIEVRVHIFETVLNALPPNFYYSAHFENPDLHLRPDLESEYRSWWGMTQKGESIADTVCAGYGWSEAFFAPRKQIAMINQQLWMRHRLTIGDVIKRNQVEWPI